MLDAITIALAALVIYICIYALLDRVCKCAEHCAEMKAYGAAIASGVCGTIDITNPKVMEVGKKNAEKLNKE